MKVAPTEMLPRMSDLNKPSLTWMSWLSRMVILISPASVDQGWTVVKFKFFSRSFLLYFVIYSGPILLAVIVSVFNGEIIQVVTKCFFDTLATYNIMDSISIFVMITALPLSALIPFAAFTGVPSISSLALAEDLLWPKYGLCSLSGAAFFISANALGKLYSVWVSSIPMDMAKSWRDKKT